VGGVGVREEDLPLSPEKKALAEKKRIAEAREAAKAKLGLNKGKGRKRRGGQAKVETHRRASQPDPPVLQVLGDHGRRGRAVLVFLTVPAIASVSACDHGEVQARRTRSGDHLHGVDSDQIGIMEPSHPAQGDLRQSVRLSPSPLLSTNETFPMVARGFHASS
jgi:hypothetical protein